MLNDHIIFNLRSQNRKLIMYEEARKHAYNLENWIETFTDITNRSIKQTYDLYYYLRGNINKLIALEINSISNYISNIPVNNAQVYNILKMIPNKNHPKYKDLLCLRHPWFHTRNKYLFTVFNRENISETVNEYKKRGTTFPTFAWYEDEPLKCIKKRLIETHADNLQYIIKDNRIVYNHVLHTSLERTHKKHRLNMIAINQDGFENFKTFYITSKDNRRTYLLKVGSTDNAILQKEETTSMLLSLLQKASVQDIKTRFDFIMADYDDNNVFLDILDDINTTHNTWLKVLAYERLEDIPDNNQFMKVDYLPKGNYYAASGVFTRNGKDAELNAEEAGKLLLSHIVYERPLVFKEEDLLASIKGQILHDITKKEIAKLKANPEKKVIKQCKARITKQYNNWLNTVVLTNQKIAFDYPTRNMSVGEFMEENYIKLIKAVYV